MSTQNDKLQAAERLAAPVRPHRGRAKWVAGAAVVLAVAAAGAAYEWQQQRPAAPAPVAAAPAAVPVTVATVEPRETTIWNAFSGRLEAVGRVEVRPLAAGTIITAQFREGAMVKQGDLLFVIDPAPYAIEVQRLEAQLAAANARLVLAGREQQRGFQLGGTNDLAQNVVDQRVNEYRAADANLHATQAQLDTARLNLGYTQVRAPISGRVGKIEVTAGNIVPAGPTAPILTTLVSVNPIYASFEADERSIAQDLASLPPGRDLPDTIGMIPVEMGTLATEGTPVKGKLQFIDNLVDARSGTVRVRAAFDNPDGRLLPGQFARIRLGQAQKAKVIAIDEQAIGTDQDHRFVMVVGPDSKVAYRQIQLGGLVDNRRIVTDGLQPGERIVVNGLQRVRPGSLVTAQERTATAAQ